MRFSSSAINWNFSLHSICKFDLHIAPPEWRAIQWKESHEKIVYRTWVCSSNFQYKTFFGHFAGRCSSKSVCKSFNERNYWSDLNERDRFKQQKTRKKFQPKSRRKTNNENDCAECWAWECASFITDSNAKQRQKIQWNVCKQLG